ncbi:MAG: DUF4406 domain-containing protein [Lachnospiraceae bacterium]|nr:DUF4406 domain-containing protein [Lachnospiraceae bacterium]
MKLYISGPITGTEDYMERFAAAQKELEEEGWSVVNPALVNSNLPEDTEWEDYMRMAVCMLDMCEVVYFLDGWEKSRGANIEYGYAQAKGKDIMFQKEYEEYRPDKSALEDLKNWPETAKGIRTYALTEDTWYEIHILHQPEGRDIMKAKASLYIAGYWRNYQRECLLAEGTVFECMLESLKDH